MSKWLPVRWLLDRAIAAVLALLAAPVVGVLAFAVKRADPGPGMIRLPRIGQGAEPFGMWKVRTMRVGRSGTAADGPAISAGNDRRVTPLGRSLRRWRLDELPQLFNVMTGRMAILGPRPEAPQYVDPENSAWATVLQARPAIAGPTQVLVHRWENAVLGDDPHDTYRDVVLPVKLALDTWYISHASPVLDVLVTISLLQQFVLRQETTLIHRRVERDLPWVCERIRADLPSRASAGQK